MPAVRFLGFPSTRAYSGSRAGCEDRWWAGEAREVPADTADYLLSEYAGFFEADGGQKEPAVSAPAEDKAPEAPPANRQVKGSPARKRK